MEKKPAEESYIPKAVPSPAPDHKRIIKEEDTTENPEKKELNEEELNKEALDGAAGGINHMFHTSEREIKEMEYDREQKKLWEEMNKAWEAQKHGANGGW